MATRKTGGKAAPKVSGRKGTAGTKSGARSGRKTGGRSRVPRPSTAPQPGDPANTVAHAQRGALSAEDASAGNVVGTVDPATTAVEGRRP